MNQTENIYIFLENSPDNETYVYATLNKNPCIDILKKYEFKSGKSLVKFLNKYKEDIINIIPDHEEDILEQLERQKFLDYLLNKWYVLDTPTSNSNNIQNYIKPDELLDIAIKYNASIEKNVSKYILKEIDDFTYDIHTQKIN